MFQKSLQDQKGVRSHKQDSTAYISKSIVSIKKELKSTDEAVKSLALQKVTYLQMIGYDVGWASFHIVEGLSMPKFKSKRIASTAACQIFRQDTDVILLTTNLLKKQLAAKNLYVSGMALNTLCNIATRELSRDLVDDVANLMTSTRPYVRKRAILALYKLFLRYPQGLPRTYERLWAKLQDAELSVISCAVNVFCELSRKKPSNYLKLAPLLFNLLTTTSNNWMLIKVAKLMASLIPVEPRLARKLLQPLANIIETTPAKSLLYECVSCVAVALQYSKKSDGSQPKIVPGLVQLCAAKLREFVESHDQNLKYLGLVGFVDLMRSHPKVVSTQRDLVLACLVDEDVNVRMRALELITGMVTKRNLVDIVQKLIEHAHAAEGAYRESIIDKVVFVCSRDKYKYLTDFTWFISILVELAHLQGSPRNGLIASKLMDVVLRVPSVRGFAAHSMATVIIEGRLAMRAAEEANLGDASSIKDQEAKLADSVLGAASFIACEYAHLQEEGLAVAFEDCEEGDIPEIVPLEDIGRAMLVPHSLRLPAHIQASFVHNALKLLFHVAHDALPTNDMHRVVAFANCIGEMFLPFSRSEFIEVQSRAVSAIALLKVLAVCTLDFDLNHMIQMNVENDSDDDDNISSDGENVFSAPTEDVQVGSLIEVDGENNDDDDDAEIPASPPSPIADFDPLCVTPTLADGEEKRAGEEDKSELEETLKLKTVVTRSQQC